MKNPAISEPSVLYARRYVIKEAPRYPIRAVTVANVLQPEGEDVLEVVWGNGAWGGPHSFGRLARRMLQVAHTHKRPMACTLYSDPWFGSRGYAAADRQERLERVVMQRADVTDRPVYMGAHSWSAEGALKVAAKHAQDKVAAFVGCTVAHHAVHSEQVTAPQLLAACRQEARAGGAIVDAGSLATFGSLGLNAAGHGLWVLRSAVREYTAADNTDLTDSLVAVSWCMPSGLLLAGRDAFFGPAHEVAQELKAAEFKGVIHTMKKATHLGTVTNHHNGDALFALVDEVSKVQLVAAS